MRAMAREKQFSRLAFSRIKDLVDFPSPENLNEITYVASATNFRRCLLNQYGDDNIDIEREITTNSDTMATYLGYRRFLVSDLKYIFPLGATRSKTAYKKDVKYLAQQMLIRGYVRTDHVTLSVMYSLLTFKRRRSPEQSSLHIPTTCVSQSTSRQASTRSPSAS